MPKITRTSYVLAVPDLETSAAFYRDVLGFTVEPDNGETGWRVYTCGDCRIMAAQCPDAIHPSKLGDHSYFAYLEVADIAAYFESVRASGAQVGDLVREEEQGMWEFCVTTADGHRIMFGSPIND